VTSGHDVDAIAGLSIGPARPHEHPALSVLEARAGELFRDVGLGDVADAEPRPAHDFARMQRDGELLVARTPSGPVGFAAVRPIDVGLHLVEMSVDPRWGRRGVGGRLLDAVAVIAREAGHTAITLTTFVDVPWNGPMYRRRGFEPLPEAGWSPDLRAQVAEEVALGLHRAPRWVMRRPIDG